MEHFVLLLLLPGMFQADITEDYNTTLDSSNSTEDTTFVFIDDNSEENTEKIQDVRLSPYQTSNNLQIYKGPLPKFPGTTTSPWIALHSPVKMYIPIRNTGENSAESADCVQCPRNLIIQLPPHRTFVRMPVPTISLCSSFARLPGRVHVAVISGPRPGQPLSVGRYEVELMVWKAEGLVHSCKYTIVVRGKRQGSVPTRNVACRKPEQPSNGILLCVPKGRKYYSHDSVCQFFCLDNYLVQNTTTNSSTIICKNGKWSPHVHVSCVAAFCPKLPRPPAHSTWSCNREDSNTKYSDGTQCKVSCLPGFVVQTSQLENTAILCKPPTWKYWKTVPDCKRAQLPKLQRCQNRHVIVRAGHTVKISDQLLPKGLTYAGAVLSPTCSLQRKTLSEGEHQNVCEVTDPELRTRHTCSYSIHVEGSSGPRPHANDCKNRTVLANRKGSIKPKPVRFLVKIGKPERTVVVRGNCKPRGELRAGSHFITCKASNPYTGSTETCSYWLKVKERTCLPLRPIPNGRILCKSRVLGSVCRYECNAGYTFPDNQLQKATKRCQANLKWQPALVPFCEIEPPKLAEGCQNLEVNVSSPVNYSIPHPTFLTALNITVTASCVPSVLKTVGHHQVECVVDNDKFNTSCQFNVLLSLEDEFNTMMPSEIEQPKLKEGCENLEVNVSSPIIFPIPQPTFLTALNITVNASCVPSVLKAVGHHQVECAVDNDQFNASCQFHVLLSLKDEFNTMMQTEIEPPKLQKGCQNLDVNVSSPIIFPIPQPTFLTALNVTVNASCVPSVLKAVGHHQVECVVDNDQFNTSCQFNVLLSLKDEFSTMMPFEIEPAKLVEGCENLEVNVSFPVNFTIPLPTFLTDLNETVKSSCVPSVLQAAGHHQVECVVDNDKFNTSCQFNVLLSLEDEFSTMMPFEIEPAKLVESCKNLEVNVSSPVNFTIPLPRYLTDLNETVKSSCVPSVLQAAGHHQVECVVDNDKFNTSCQFNIFISLEDEFNTMMPFEIKPAKLVDGCENLEVNVSSPVNFTIPLPRFLTDINETVKSSCVPSVLQAAGHHQVECVVDNDKFNTSCQFNILLSLEDEFNTMVPFEIEPPKLVEGCENLEVNVSSPVSFTIPLPRFLTALNETIKASCVPSVLKAVGYYQVECVIDNDKFNTSCQFNVSISLEHEFTTTMPSEIEPPKLEEGCHNLEVNVSSPVNFIIPQPRYLIALNETVNAHCVPSVLKDVGHHQVECVINNDKFNTSCQFNISISLEEDFAMVKTSDIQPPKLDEGCQNLEINMSSPINFTIPQPRFLTTLNERLNASCVPSILQDIGHHEVNCVIYNDKFNTTCQFNVSISLEDDFTMLLPSENPPQLKEGCVDLDVNMSFPINYTVPLPQFLTSLNETASISCFPSTIEVAGQHIVKCAIDDDSFNLSCNFNVSILSENEPVTTSTSNEAQHLELFGGCDDLVVNVSSPVNFTVPLPQYLTSQNDILVASCTPSIITTVGQHQVKCFIDIEYFNKSCNFSVMVLLEDGPMILSSSEIVDLVELVEGCNDFDVNISSPINFAIPLPRYLTSQNVTLEASCTPPFITVPGQHQIQCFVNNDTFNESCNFTLRLLLDKPLTTPSPDADSCVPLRSPLHSSIKCSSQGQIETCLMTCDPGYGFSDDYSFTTVCDGNSDGLWDFQKSDLNGSLPQCYAQVEGSAVELWISFEAFAPHCEEELEDQMKDLINKLCQTDCADCSKLDINCTLDEESDMMFVNVNWTVLADFNNEEYIDDEEIPEAETRLENVLERTRTFLATEDAPEGLHLFRDSFRRGFMTLVCPIGFTPDMMMAKCVQCPAETGHC